jgi:glycosyltransferase involved in cell wall biosynthesis
MPSPPTISAIIPAYNAAAFIGSAIESALAQTCPPVEIIVVDDGSTDDTAEVVRQFAEPVRLLTQTNGGPAAARNHAARAASGEWLAFLDADDLWLPQKLEREIAFISDASVAIVHCLAEGQEEKLAIPDDVDFERLWTRNCISNSSVLLRRTAFEQAGGFDEDRSLIGVEDYNLWLRLAAAGWRIVTCREALWRYTPAPNSLSSQVERFAQCELNNVEHLKQALNLPEAKCQQKRLAVRELYGMYLFSLGEMKAARRFLAPTILNGGSLRGLQWWMATCIPGPVLRWRQMKRARSNGGMQPTSIATRS